VLSARRTRLESGAAGPRGRCVAGRKAFLDGGRSSGPQSASVNQSRLHRIGGHRQRLVEPEGAELSGVAGSSVRTRRTPPGGGLAMPSSWWPGSRLALPGVMRVRSPSLPGHRWPSASPCRSMVVERATGHARTRYWVPRQMIPPSEFRRGRSDSGHHELPGAHRSVRLTAACGP